MKLFRFAMLLLVQLSPLFVHGQGETDFKCKGGGGTENVTVVDASAHLTKGCVLKGIGITFDLKTMYEAAAKKTPKTPVVIDISGAHFIDSYIKLINADSIPEAMNAVPLLFTMSKSKMSGTSKLEFGSEGKLFKLPSKSLIRIIDSELTLTSSNAAKAKHYLITFNSLELVDKSSIELARNVITMECEGCASMTVFYLPTKTAMMISDKSSFTIRGNKITMTGHTSTHTGQFVWYQGRTSNLTISETSIYTWASNDISMVGYGLNGSLKQNLWYQYIDSPLTISDTSSYTWLSNIISLLGYNIIGLIMQCVWHQETNSPLTISDSSSYTFSSNTISVLGHDVTDGHRHQQYVWFQDSTSSLTMSKTSTYTWASNTINMEGYNLNMIDQHILSQYYESYLTISQTSTYKWASNVISMLAYNLLKHLTQAVSSLEVTSLLTISDTSTYTWTSNFISLVGYNVTGRHLQYVWNQDYSTVTISDTSKYTWLMNSISMDGHDVTQILQHVWCTFESITISALSQFLFDSNRILLLAMDYNTTILLWSYVMMIKATTTSTISGESSMVLRNNCVGMGHKEDSKRRVFRGNWTIKDKSKLLLDGNYITTTDKYELTGTELTQLVWEPNGGTDITSVSQGALTIRNTKVYANSDATSSMLWVSSPFTSETSVKLSAMEWTSSPAKDGKGSPVPTLDNSNLRQYMCVGLLNIPGPTSPTTVVTRSTARSPSKADYNTKTTKATVKSATTILSTVPGLLITSVVFLYLYNW